ncbi:hypothetical protein AAMO2058_000307000 [Amorphochlora amoebiformis]
MAALPWVVAALVLDGAIAEGGSSVIKLTDDNFDDFTSTGSWILKFYAPWCGHCRRMAEDFETAAAEMEGKIGFGEIDCTKQKSLKTRFEVKGYPTLKFYRDGEARPYRSGRKAENLIEYAKSMSRDPIQRVTTSTVDTMMENHGVSFVYVDGSKDASISGEFQKIAKKYQGLYFFGSAVGKAGSSFSKKFRIDTTPAVAYLTKGGIPDVTTDLGEESLDAFIKEHPFSLVTEINSHTFSDVSDNGKPVMIVVMKKPKEDSDRLLSAAYAPALALQGTVLTAKIDGKRFSSYLDQFGVRKSGAPKILIVDYETEIYWHSPSDILTSEGDLSLKIQEWVEGALDGKIPYTPLVAWYNPRRYMRLVSKALRGYSETTIMILMISASIMGAVLLFTCFSYLDADFEPPRQEAQPIATQAPAPTTKPKEE